jgi:hypothetical protein
MRQAARESPLSLVARVRVSRLSWAHPTSARYRGLRLGERRETTLSLVIQDCGYPTTLADGPLTDAKKTYAGWASAYKGNPYGRLAWDASMATAIQNGPGPNIGDLPRAKMARRDDSTADVRAERVNLENQFA